MTTQWNCIYCGPNTNRKSEEHIIPVALGGTEVIKMVCRVCNNEILSKLDTALSKYSPLAIVSARILGDTGEPNIWLQDAATGLLVESKYSVEQNNYVPLPQIILEGDRPTIRADLQDIHAVGVQDFRDVFTSRLIKAYRDYEQRLTTKVKKKEYKGVIFQKPFELMRKEGILYPPRVAFTKPLSQIIEKPSSPLARYLDHSDKKLILNTLSKLKPQGIARLSRKPSSQSASTLLIFEADQVLRALLKISYNVLSYLSHDQPLRREEYEKVVRVILGTEQSDSRSRGQIGFFNPTFLPSDLITTEKQHTIWVQNVKNHWGFIYSFFGGAMAAICNFPGKPIGAWSWAEVAMNLDDKSCTSRTYSFYPPIDKRISVEWSKLDELVPSLPLKGNTFHLSAVASKK